MMLPRWMLALGMMLLAIVPGAARAEVRAVFVGIDHYQFSAARVKGADFGDLQGAVADAVLMRDTLNAAFGFGFGGSPDHPCWTKPMAAKAIFLANDCATHDVILDAIDTQILASRAGDTLIIYLAGHGSSIGVGSVVPDGAPASQVSGAYSTFLAYDARDPQGDRLTEILDVQFGNRIELAKARGVHVVQIGDYCNSGTGARGVSSPEIPRTAPMLKPAKPMPVHLAEVPAPVATPGHVVWLGASLDSEQSFETQVSTAPELFHGVFTLALTDVLQAPHVASFDDIMIAVRQRVGDNGHRVQHPQGEGELSAALGPGGLTLAPVDARPIDVVRTVSGAWVLPYAGALAGMTKGSELDIYTSVDAAIGRTRDAPVSHATIASVTPDSAMLAVNPPIPGTLPASLFARETSHATTAAPIRLRIEPIFAQAPQLAGPNRQLQAMLQDVRKAIPGVEVAEPASLFLGFYPPDRLGLYDLSGASIGAIGRFGDPMLTPRLIAALSGQARVNELLAVQHTGAKLRPPRLCITAVPFDPYDCTAAAATKEVALNPGAAMVTVVNQDANPAYLTVLAIAPDNTIEVVLPQRAGHDQLAGANAHVQTGSPIMVFTTAGTCRYIAFATTLPLDTAQWRQSGMTAVTSDGQPAASPCGGSVERPGLLGASGAADMNQVGKADWSTTRVDATIGKPANARKLQP